MSCRSPNTQNYIEAIEGDQLLIEEGLNTQLKKKTCVNKKRDGTVQSA